MPFMNMPPGALLSSTAIVLYGKAVRALRRLTQEKSLNQEPEWRHR
jgi:hydrogenase small subunit